MTDIMQEMKRLHALGWAIHWIRPNSKAPVDSGWTTGERKSREALIKQYAPGMGIGVRLGKASRLEPHGYLCNIDVDIKSSDPEHRKEALKKLGEIYPGLLNTAPIVKTGYGLRLFVKTKEPVPSGKIATSKDEIKVYMPSAPINRKQELAVKKGILTQKELNDGYRARAAWELDLMSEGRQVVLPPSIHPETKKLYRWAKEDYDLRELPLLKVNPQNKSDTSGEHQESLDLSDLKRFRPVPVDLSRLPPSIAEMLVSGENVADRSAACFTVTIAMVKEGYTTDEILTALTDPDNFLGQTAYDHRQTKSRRAAAAWVRDYCLKKAKKEYADITTFESEVVVTELEDKDLEAQNLFIEEGRPWQEKLIRSGKNGEGPIKPLMKNIVCILKNAIGPDIFKFDEFSNQEYYGLKAPWENGVKGKPVDDADSLDLKMWLSTKWGFEPSSFVVSESITHFAKLNTYHPVRDQLEALPPWDGIDRLDTWLKKYFHAEGDDEYLAQVFRKWLIASVTRTYEPGAKFDWMPIFEGAQGTGKSSFGAILFGYEYFTDWLPRLEDKDAALSLHGKRCAEFGELSTLRRSDLEAAKAFITRQVDKVRPPYGRKAIICPRQVVFFGTTNQTDYLKDQSGNRRFLPVKVGKLDFKALTRDRVQLWAEALYRYKWCPESLYIENGAVLYAEKIQEDKREMGDIDIMGEKLLDFFDQEIGKPNPAINLNRFSMCELFEGVGGPLGNWRMDGRHVQYAAKALKYLEKKSEYAVTKRIIQGRNYWKIEKEIKTEKDKYPEKGGIKVNKNNLINLN